MGEVDMMRREDAVIKGGGGVTGVVWCGRRLVWCCQLCNLCLMLWTLGLSEINGTDAE